jgi:hypothetical protein
MNNKKNILVFSDEIINFSKLIDKSFNKISLDIKNIKKDFNGEGFLLKKRN